MEPESAGSRDVEQLHSLGYAQELRRGMRTFSNFAVSFTIISILSGCLTLFLFAMNTGGPAVMTPRLAVRRILRHAGGAWHGRGRLSYPDRGRPLLLVGEAGTCVGPRPGEVELVRRLVQPARAGRGHGRHRLRARAVHHRVPEPGVRGHCVTPTVTIAVYGVMLVLHALLNTFGIRLVKLLNDVSVWWHIVGVGLIVVVCVLLNQHTRTDLGTVFTTTVNNTGFESSQGFGLVFLGIPLYVALIGLLNAQYTLTGFDASAHMSEETHDADTSSPKGIVWSVVISVIFGFILLVAMNVGITPEKIFTGTDGSQVDGYTHALQSATGVPPVQIWIDAVGQTLGMLVLLVVIGAQFYCGMSSVTANSRMIYAFSRDGAVPGSKFWHRINKRTRTPTNSIWLAAVGAFILGLPYLYSPVAYAAITSIAVIGLYVAYIAPVFLRLRAGDKFQAGPWNLGRWSRPIGIVATIWVVFIFILFMLPQAFPITIQTFNYTPVVFLVVLGGAAIWYAVSAKNWFKGPKVQGSAEELAAIERDLEVI